MTEKNPTPPPVWNCEHLPNFSRVTDGSIVLPCENAATAKRFARALNEQHDKLQSALQQAEKERDKWRASFNHSLDRDLILTSENAGLKLKIQELESQLAAKDGGEVKVNAEEIEYSDFIRSISNVADTGDVHLKNLHFKMKDGYMTLNTLDVTTKPKPHPSGGEHGEGWSEIVAALELWQTFDPRVHTAIDAAKFYVNGLKALTQFRTSQTATDHG